MSNCQSWTRLHWQLCCINFIICQWWSTYDFSTSTICAVTAKVTKLRRFQLLKSCERKKIKPAFHNCQVSVKAGLPVPPPLHPTCRNVWYYQQQRRSNEKYLLNKTSEGHLSHDCHLNMCNFTINAYLKHCTVSACMNTLEREKKKKELTEFNCLFF